METISYAATRSSIETDVRKPTQVKESTRSMQLPSFFKSLGPLTKQDKRDISGGTAETVDTAFSDNDEQDSYQDIIISSQEAGCDWDLDLSLDGYGTENEDEYIVLLKDSSGSSSSAMNFAKSCPRRREILMDNFEHVIMLQEFDITVRRNSNLRLRRRRQPTVTKEEPVGEDYEVPVQDTDSAQSGLFKPSDPKKMELLLDDFEWKSLRVAESSDVESVDSDDGESISENEVLYQYFTMMKSQSS